MSENETEEVVISFDWVGENSLETWKEPKVGMTRDGRKVTVAPGIGENGVGWRNPLVIEPTEGATVIESFPDHRTGCWTVKVRVPAVS